MNPETFEELEYVAVMKLDTFEELDDDEIVVPVVSWPKVAETKPTS